MRPSSCPRPRPPASSSATRGRSCDDHQKSCATFCLHPNWQESTNQEVCEVGRVCKYYSDWQHETFTCSQCGWAGTAGCQDLEAGDVAAIIECPKCYRSLGVLLYPNLQETKEAAAQGNEEAIKALPSFESRVEQNWELLDRFEKEKLRSADQLPNLDRASLEFVWDFQKRGGRRVLSGDQSGRSRGMARASVLQQYAAV